MLVIKIGLSNKQRRVREMSDFIDMERLCREIRMVEESREKQTKERETTENFKEENRVLKDALLGIKSIYSSMQDTIDDLSEGNIDYEDAIDEIISDMVGIKGSFEYIKNELGKNYFKKHPTSKGE